MTQNGDHDNNWEPIHFLVHQLSRTVFSGAIALISSYGSYLLSWMNSKPGVASCVICVSGPRQLSSVPCRHPEQQRHLGVADVGVALIYEQTRAHRWSYYRDYCQCLPNRILHRARHDVFSVWRNSNVQSAMDRRGLKVISPKSELHTLLGSFCHRMSAFGFVFETCCYELAITVNMKRAKYTVDHLINKSLRSGRILPWVPDSGR